MLTEPAMLPAVRSRHRRSRRSRGGEQRERRGDWVALGSAAEGKPAAAGTVEAWARAGDNPVGGWCGLNKGVRGRFANHVRPLLEALGLAEVEHEPPGNRMRAG